MKKNSPQKENGYTPIANELLEALAKIRISGEACQVLHYLFRKTYGWNKKDDFIALSQFVKGTNLKKPAVCRALKHLISLNVIIKKDNAIIKKDNEAMSSYGINKHYRKWRPLSKKITLSKKIMTVIEKDKGSLSKKIHTKDTSTKDTLTKDNKTKENGKSVFAFIGLWQSLNKELYQGSEVPRTGKFIGHCKSIVKDLGYKKAADLAEAYFQMREYWIVKMGHDIVTFYRNIHKVEFFMNTGKYMTGDTAKKIEIEDYNERQKRELLESEVKNDKE